MSYCFNPNCPHPDNPHAGDRCQHCDSPLRLPNGGRVLNLRQEDSFYRFYDAVSDHGEAWELKVLTLLHPRAKALLAQEARVLTALAHPSLPRVVAPGYFELDLGRGREPLPCLLLEKSLGFSLSEWQGARGNEPISEAIARQWLRELVTALGALHHHLHFHRDIQPDNILLHPQHPLTLIDLASSREVALSYLTFAQHSLNRNQSSSGIPGFVSPGYTPWEQIQGKGVPQSDFFRARTHLCLLTGRKIAH
jgi:serine/threonine protein kinase